VFETPDGPPGYFGGLLPAESPAEKLLHAVLRKQVRIFKRLMFFLFRKTFRDAGLASVYREDGSEQVYSDEAILAVGLPELEFSRSYPGHFHFIGALNFTPPIDDERRPHFNEGKKHVMVTLGTHLGHRKDAIAERIREMADRFRGGCSISATEPRLRGKWSLSRHFIATRSFPTPSTLGVMIWWSTTAAVGLSGIVCRGEFRRWSCRWISTNSTTRLAFSWQERRAG
jgi:UDP:flavonoid glycosyltransferase YjiC (YdhE family)